MRKAALPIAVLVWLLAAAFARASDCWPYGVSSDMLIDEGRVIFTQPDSTLTALDLKTGKVLARATQRVFGHHIQLVSAGIFSSGGSGHAVLVDRQSLRIIWEAPVRFAMVCGEFVYYGDDTTRVGVRDLKTGKMIANIPDAQYCERAGDHMLVGVRRPGPPTGSAPSGSSSLEETAEVDSVEARDPDLKVAWLAEGMPTIAAATDEFTIIENHAVQQCRRVRDGQVLWSRDAKGYSYPQIQGPWVVSHIEKIQGPDQPRHYTIEVRRLADGQVAAKFEIPSELRDKNSPAIPVVRFDPPRLIYVLPLTAATPPEASRPFSLTVLDAEGKQVEPTDEDMRAAFDGGRFPSFDNAPVGRWAFTYTHLLSANRACVTTFFRWKTAVPNQTIRQTLYATLDVTPPDGPSWRALLPAVRSKDQIHQPRSSGGLLLIPYGNGGIECIDVAARKSLWMYRCRPGMSTIQRLGEGKGPYITSMLWESREIYLDPDRSLRSFILPGGYDVDSARPDDLLSLARRSASSEVIWDPAPTGHFLGQGGRVAFVWLAGLGPLIVTLVMLLALRRRWLRLNLWVAGFVCLPLSMLPHWALFNQYEPVDWTGTQLMMASVVIPCGVAAAIGFHLLFATWECRQSASTRQAPRFIAAIALAGLASCLFSGGFSTLLLIFSWRA